MDPSAPQRDAPARPRPRPTLRSHLGGQILADHFDGAGPTLLALHGWRRDRGDLPFLITGEPGPLRGRSAIAVDLPGFGSSPPPPEPWGAREYAVAVAAMLDESGTGEVLVLGHSFGGRVAVCLAAARPELVSGAVVLGAPLVRTGPARKPAISFRLARAANRIGLLSDGTMERLRHRGGSEDYRAAEGVMRQVLVRSVGETYEEELARIRCRAVLLWGELDRAAPPAMATLVAAAAGPPVRVEVVAGGGHDLHRDHPDLVAEAVVEVASPPPSGRESR